MRWWPASSPSGLPTWAATHDLGAPITPPATPDEPPTPEELPGPGDEPTATAATPVPGQGGGRHRLEPAAAASSSTAGLPVAELARRVGPATGHDAHRLHRSDRASGSPGGPPSWQNVLSPDPRPESPGYRADRSARGWPRPGPPPPRPRSPRWWTGLAALVLAAGLAGWGITTSLPTHDTGQLPPPDTNPYGATGALPGALITPLPDTAPGQPPRAAGLPPATGLVGIPATVLGAYHGAETQLAGTAPGCRLSWSLIAGIGKIESDHARGGQVDTSGTTTAPILGPVLNGSAGTAAIADTDGGRLDGNPVWDRAVGPMQFLPSTWQSWGADATGAGRADPGNVYDATVAAGRYLCAGRLDTSTPAGAHDAVFRYNHSEAYVAHVLAWAHAYATGTLPTPDHIGTGTGTTDGPGDGTGNAAASTNDGGSPGPAPAPTGNDPRLLAAPAPTLTAPEASAPTHAPTGPLIPITAPSAAAAPSPVAPSPVAPPRSLPGPILPTPSIPAPSAPTQPPPPVATSLSAPASSAPASSAPASSAAAPASTGSTTPAPSTPAPRSTPAPITPAPTHPTTTTPTPTTTAPTTTTPAPPSTTTPLSSPPVAPLAATPTPRTTTTPAPPALSPTPSLTSASPTPSAAVLSPAALSSGTTSTTTANSKTNSGGSGGTSGRSGGGASGGSGVLDTTRSGIGVLLGNVQTEGAPRPQIVTTSGGTRGLRFTMPGGGRRSEVLPPLAEYRDGAQVWLHYRAQLSRVPVDTNTWQLIAQFHQNGNSGSPPVALEVGHGQLRLANQGAHQQSLGPVAADGVVDVVLHVRFSRDPSRGQVDVWRDGNPVLTGYHPPGGTLLDSGDYLKLALPRPGDHHRLGGHAHRGPGRADRGQRW